MSEEHQDIRKIELLADYSKADHTYDEPALGNHVLAPLMVKNQYGKLSSSTSGYKLWMQKEQYRNILPAKLPFIPHEFLNGVLSEYTEQFVDVVGEEFKSLGGKWNIQKPEFSHQEMTCFWKILSDKFYTVKGSANVGDDIQLGVVIRNGINTNVALGADLFTYRLVCKNGAVARGPNLGTVLIKHIGDKSRIIESFRNGLRVVFTRMKDLMEYYEEATKIKMNQQILEQLYDGSNIADKYWPNYVNILPNPDKGHVIPTKDKVTLTPQGTKNSLYETFNDLTDKLSRAYENRVPLPGATRSMTGLGLTSLYRYTNALHHEMMQIVDTGRN
jgi:hypothetical protein